MDRRKKLKRTSRKKKKPTETNVKQNNVIFICEKVNNNHWKINISIITKT